MKKLILIAFLSITTLVATAKPISNLPACYTKQVKPLQANYFTFSFTENLNELEHSFFPWQQTNYTAKGTIWLNADNFLKSDTLTRFSNNQNYFSKTQYNKSNLLFLDYGDTSLFASTQNMFLNQLVKSARYSPLMLINYFFKLNVIPTQNSINYMMFQTTINKTQVKLYISKATNLADKIITISNDELFGDVTTTYNYTHYTKTDSLFYPALINIQKINGKITDEVKILTPTTTNLTPTLLQAPASYKLVDEKETPPQTKLIKYSKNIYFLEIKHTDDKILIAEFKNFLVVEGAPLNSKNGELIINEAKKIAPNKPIKYFTFGHYHPHYLGGMRPFINAGATVLSVPADTEYVHYLAEAPHTIVLDSLQLHPKPVQIKIVNDSTTISDGKFELKIYFIGKNSQHTNDYLIYYFPTEKLLFEDDLVWISSTGPITKAGGRQLGLYNAIKKLSLNVSTIVQSWPVADYGVKTIIPFADLETSAQIK